MINFGCGCVAIDDDEFQVITWCDMHRKAMQVIREHPELAEE